MKRIALSFLFLAGFSGLLMAQIKDFSKPTDQYFEISKNLEIFSNIFKELNNSYVDPIEPGQMVKTGVDAMLRELDPYTNFYTETDKEEYEFQTAGKYAGIGAGLQLIDSNFYVGRIIENTPVHKSGIKTGDQIYSVNDVVLKGKAYDEVILLLRGAPGTDLSVKIISSKDGSEKEIKLTRESIELKSVPIFKLIGKENRTAYVSLTQFTQNCSGEIKRALDSLKRAEPNLDGVVLDLRGNPGGLLIEAVRVCNLFLPKGQLVVSTKGKNPSNDQKHYTQNEPWDDKIPLVILINNESASASEIVAGTVQDTDRGVVIGTRSFGKGLVQNVVSLGYNTSLKLTIAKYYTASGRCIQALDYSHRNPDGSVSAVPDSLKKAFSTANGRTVYDGGGIEPDIVTKDQDLNRALISLLNNGQIFEYATQYYNQHSTISSPEEFYISDEEFKKFMKYIDDKKFNYKSGSEELIAILEKTMEKEMYLDQSKATIKKLKEEIEGAKKALFLKGADDIKRLLSSEIASRYYYEKGGVINRLYHNDDELNKAMEILEDLPNKYSPILKKK